MTLPKQILDMMEKNPKFKYTAKIVYQILFYHAGKIDKKLLAQIRTTMNRMHKQKKIRKLQRGYYQIKPSPPIIQKLEQPNVKVHGIKLEYRLSENNIFGIEGITPQHNILMYLKNNNFEDVNNSNGVFLKRLSKNIWWEERKITITIHNSGLIETFCSTGDNPMSMPDFFRFYDFMRGLLNPVCNFERNKVMVRQVALNRDFEELVLDGVSSVTLKRFMNDWCRIYQHDDVVRYEHHLTLDITLEDAFNSLQLLTGSPDVKYSNGKPDERRDVA